tara:strand:- start:4237 stop:4923 length:687 start_codon:yes stop_codon:yes gene_type:complete
MSVIVSGSTNIGYKTSTDGLSLYLDARNSNSYPGSGDTWYDLSTGVNNVSTRFATYNSTAPANFNISGSINTIDFTSIAPTSEFTIETVIKPTSLPNSYNIFLNFDNTFRIYFDNNYNIFYWAGDINNNSSSIYVSALSFPVDQWQYFSFVLRGGIGQSPSNSRLYKNGTLLNSSGGSAGSVNYNNGVGQIFGDTNVSCSVFKTYNRSLTQAEITNNYNYYKPIFNLS